MVRSRRGSVQQGAIDQVADAHHLGQQTSVIDQAPANGHVEILDDGTTVTYASTATRALLKLKYPKRNDKEPVKDKTESVESDDGAHLERQAMLDAFKNLPYDTQRAALESVGVVVELDGIETNDGVLSGIYQRVTSRPPQAPRRGTGAPMPRFSGKRRR